MIDPRTNNKGFALLVVLFGLAIITALFAISTKRLNVYLSNAALEAVLARRAFEEASLVLLAAGLPAETEEFLVPQGYLDHGKTVTLRPVSGLIDLNTASRPFLTAYFERLELPRQSLSNFLAWREMPHRLLRLSDLARVADIVGTDFRSSIGLQATVFSGRAGVSPEDVSEALVMVMGWGGGIVPEEFQAPPNRSNYMVSLHDAEIGDASPLGTIFRSTDGTIGQLLELE